MTTRAAARQRQRRVNARWRAAALPGSYTTFWDTTESPSHPQRNWQTPEKSR
jgi:hypothetical protein